MITMGQMTASVAVIGKPRKYCVIRLDQRFKGIKKQTDNIWGRSTGLRKVKNITGSNRCEWLGNMRGLETATSL